MYFQFCGNYAVIFYAVDVFSGIGIKHVVMEMMMEGKTFNMDEESQVTNVTSTYLSGYKFFKTLPRLKIMLIFHAIYYQSFSYGNFQTIQKWR